MRSASSILRPMLPPITAPASVPATIATVRPVPPPMVEPTTPPTTAPAMVPFCSLVGGVSQPASAIAAKATVAVFVNRFILVPFSAHEPDGVGHLGAVHGLDLVLDLEVSD